MSSHAVESPAAPPEAVTVTSPATGVVVGQVPNLDEHAVAALVDRARAAQPAWAALGFRERGRLMKELRAWIVAERSRIIRTLGDEAGKAHEDALIEVFALCGTFGFWARHAERHLRDERTWSRSPLVIGKRVVVRHVPLGVVGVIAPWNYPLVLGLGDAIPALMAGNTVVLKPSGITPLSSVLVVQEGMRAVGFPPDVCLVATGRGAAGSALVDTADMIQFTGSTAVGRQIAARAADRLIPASLELGGNDPMIVLADADLERAANLAVFHCMSNAGQTCMSVERVFVEAPVYDDFVARVVNKVSGLRQGVPAGPGSVDVGSLTGPGQIDLVAAQVQDAVARGARVLVGGHALRDGDFYVPTVLVDVDETMVCMREETFGPVLPIRKVADAEEAIRLANDTDLGLNSSVITRDVARGEQIARRLEAGNACINDALVNFADLSVPFTGWKQSGLGGRHGAAGILKFTKPQTIMTTRYAPRREPYMYPRRAGTTRVLDRLMVWFYGRGA